MAYTPYQYPNYTPYYPQPGIDLMGQMRQQQMQQQQTAAASMLTPPTIHAEIVQVDGEATAAKYPVGAGMSQMMMARDESAIFVKTATANGYTMDVFEKRPPAPQPAPFNPDEYVRLDALPGLISAEIQAAVAAAQPVRPSRPRKDPEVAE